MTTWGLLEPPVEGASSKLWREFVEQVKALPEDWLGKKALVRGAKESLKWSLQQERKYAKKG